MVPTCTHTYLSRMRLCAITVVIEMPTSLSGYAYKGNVDAIAVSYVLETFCQRPQALSIQMVVEVSLQVSECTRINYNP